MAVRSIRALARLMGRSHSTVGEWVKRPDFPTRRKAPWSDADVQAIKAWAGLLQPNRAKAEEPDDDLARLKLQAETLYKKERALREKLRREIDQGQWVKRDLLDGAVGGVCRLFVDALTELELTLPERLAGKTAGQIKMDLAKVCDGVRRRIIERGEYEYVKVTDLARKDER